MKKRNFSHGKKAVEEGLINLLLIYLVTWTIVLNFRKKKKEKKKLQILSVWLLSEHVLSHQFSLDFDMFVTGSIGDCNIPGNATLLYDINFVEIYSGNRSK